MKKAIITLVAISLLSSLTAQVVNKGWYYFQTPMSDVFGVGYTRPVENSILIPLKDNQVKFTESDLKIIDGPSESMQADNGWRDIVLTSVFQKSKKVTIVAHAYNLKTVTLAGSAWSKLLPDRYYILQAQRADSIVITGSVKKEFRTGSSDVEKIIAAFVPGGTVAFKVVEALTNKDKESNGIVSYKTGRTDTFSIVVRNPKVYFNANFLRYTTNPRDLWKRAISVQYPNAQATLELNEDNEATILQDFLVDGIGAHGVELGLNLKYDENAKTVTLSIRQQDTGGEEIFKVIKTVSIGQASKKIKASYTYTDGEASTGHSSSKETLTVVECEIDFDPRNKKVIVHGYENQVGQLYHRTCIYQMLNKTVYWP